MLWSVTAFVPTCCSMDFGVQPAQLISRRGSAYVPELLDKLIPPRLSSDPPSKEAPALGTGRRIFHLECTVQARQRQMVSARSTYIPPAFCGSRDTSARRFRLRIKRWR